MTEPNEWPEEVEHIEKAPPKPMGDQLNEYMQRATAALEESLGKKNKPLMVRQRQSASIMYLSSTDLDDLQQQVNTTLGMKRDVDTTILPGGDLFFAQGKFVQPIIVTSVVIETLEVEPPAPPDVVE